MASQFHFNGDEPDETSSASSSSNHAPQTPIRTKFDDVNQGAQDNFVPLSKVHAKKGVSFSNERKQSKDAHGRDNKLSFSIGKKSKQSANGCNDKSTSSELRKENQKIDKVERKSLSLKPTIVIKQGSSSNGLKGENRNVTTLATKPRIKLSLKLPTMKSSSTYNEPKADDRKVFLKEDEDEEDNDETAIHEVQAMVVDSDEAGEDDAIATAVPIKLPSAVVSGKTSSKVKSSTSNESSTSAKAVKSESAQVPTPSKSINQSSKRRPFYPSRQLRIPPISSPGLLMPVPPSSSQSSLKIQGIKSDARGFCTPREVFNMSMEASGYTLEKRIQEPHRGSSVMRTVDDMFDSNVVLSVHFPALVPKDLVPEESPDCATKEEFDSLPGNSYLKNDSARLGMNSTVVLMNRLRECMETSDLTSSNRQKESEKVVPFSSTRKRKIPLSFENMIPVSLTLPYPDDFLNRRKEYVKSVKEREKAITEWQIHQEDLEIAKEKSESIEPAFVTSIPNGDEQLKQDEIRIPPIPSIPDPPTLEDMQGFEAADLYASDEHPYYVPIKKDFVSHLDRKCFHITDGRYFGLSTNLVADPNFSGANAPGIATISATGGTGLATTTFGSGATSGGMAFILSSSYHSAAASSTVPQSRSSNFTETNGGTLLDIKGEEDKATPKAAIKHPSTPIVHSSSKNSSNKKSSSSSISIKKVSTSQKPTGTAADLRRIMEEGGTQADSLKTLIISAAVHGSRLGKHTQTFVGPDGIVYPDVGKAFAAHAGIKPCQRCKSNKQGVYHCRLRRRHEETDYDGGNSQSVLGPLFKAPVESIIGSKN